MSARGARASRARLKASERRAAVLECACRAFSRGSYRGTTTAEIAREAGVTEPILYRHFDSKRHLYLAALDESWRRVRALWDETIAAEPDPALWLAAMGLAFLESKQHRPAVANLWVHALAEAGEDEEIRRYLRAHMHEVHAFVAGVVRRAQDAGGIPPDRDPDAEAWIFLSIGLLSMADRRLGELVGEAWPAIIASRRRSVTGRA